MAIGALEKNRLGRIGFLQQRFDFASQRLRHQDRLRRETLRAPRVGEHGLYDTAPRPASRVQASCERSPRILRPGFKNGLFKMFSGRTITG